MAQAKPRKAIVKAAKATAALAVPEAAVPLAALEKAAKVTGDVLTGDLVVTRTLVNIGTKKKPVWRETEIHYNPLGIGLGAAGVAAAALIGTIAWQGFRTVGGGVQGIKGTPLGDKISQTTGGGGSGGGGGGGSGGILCGPACAAIHVFDPWNIPACLARCLAGQGVG